MWRVAVGCEVAWDEEIATAAADRLQAAFERAGYHHWSEGVAIMVDETGEKLPVASVLVKPRKIEDAIRVAVEAVSPVIQEALESECMNVGDFLDDGIIVVQTMKVEGWTRHSPLVRGPLSAIARAFEAADRDELAGRENSSH